MNLAVTVKVFKTAPVINENSMSFLNNLNFFLTFGSTGEREGNQTERIVRGLKVLLQYFS